MKKLKTIIVGAGGVASYLLPVLTRTFACEGIIVDKDILEDRNLDRQLFREDQIGRYKAEALCELYPQFYPDCRWFDSSFDVGGYDAVICVADNHPARKAVMSAVDLAEDYGVLAIIGGNEYFDSEAYLYNHAWRGKRLDPRIYYPNLLTDRQGDPISCQGTEQTIHPQLAIANMRCASMIMDLLWAHRMADESVRTMDGPVRDLYLMSLPVHTYCSGTRTTTKTMQDYADK